jgi:histidinol dehydrogenase
MKLLRSSQRGFAARLDALSRRLTAVDKGVDGAVRPILEAVRRQGDAAVVRFTRRFDKARLTAKQFRVSEKEMEEAYRQADPAVVDSLRYAAERITAFHQKQHAGSWSFTNGGITLGVQVRPLDRVGIYVPGGTAVYPSSVLMNALPARIAGVRQLAMCTPVRDGVINPYLLVAADLAGVREIYKIGGAQAIAALAYGTKTIPRVDKIVGPGNRYVAAAKRLVYGTVDIDMVAGPSEVLIVADQTANPAYVAADLLAQAEHDQEAWLFLVSPLHDVIRKTMRELTHQLKALGRRNIAAAAIKRHGVAVLVKDLEEAAVVANAIAPEHLGLAIKKPFELVPRLNHVGAVFLGHFTPESVGDYVAGPNHVLPTGGTARFFSPLSVDDFVKRTNLIGYSQEELIRARDHIVRIAGVEGLDAHARAVEIRLRG